MDASHLTHMVSQVTDKERSLNTKKHQPCWRWSQSGYTPSLGQHTRGTVGVNDIRVNDTTSSPFHVYRCGTHLIFAGLLLTIKI